MSVIQNRSIASVFGSPQNHPTGMNIGFMLASSVTVATPIVTIDVFEDLELDALAVEGSNINQWSVTNTITGELTYNGSMPFSGTLIASLTASSQGAQFRFLFRAVKNGLILIDDIVAAAEIGNNEVRVTMIAPVSADPGDTIRMQVANNAGTSDLFVREIAVEIS